MQWIMSDQPDAATDGAAPNPNQTVIRLTSEEQAAIERV